MGGCGLHLFWLTIVTSGRCCEHDCGPSLSTKFGERLDKFGSVELYINLGIYSISWACVYVCR
jgi:hypothetical protein